jgi:hypothetical protein
MGSKLYETNLQAAFKKSVHFCAVKFGGNSDLSV